MVTVVKDLDLNFICPTVLVSEYILFSTVVVLRASDFHLCVEVTRFPFDYFLYITDLFLPFFTSLRFPFHDDILDNKNHKLNAL